MRGLKLFGFLNYEGGRVQNLREAGEAAGGEGAVIDAIDMFERGKGEPGWKMGLRGEDGLDGFWPISLIGRRCRGGYRVEDLLLLWKHECTR